MHVSYRFRLWREENTHLSLGARIMGHLFSNERWVRCKVGGNGLHFISANGKSVHFECVRITFRAEC